MSLSQRREVQARVRNTAGLLLSGILKPCYRDAMPTDHADPDTDKCRKHRRKSSMDVRNQNADGHAVVQTFVLNTVSELGAGAICSQSSWCHIENKGQSAKCRESIEANSLRSEPFTISSNSSAHMESYFFSRSTSSLWLHQSRTHVAVLSI